MKKLLFGTIMVFALCAFATGAPVVAEEPPTTASLEDLSWIAGCWGGQLEKSYVEECWIAPRGGLMLGLNRSVRDDGKRSFEYLRIEASEDGIVYYASPGGSPATPFKMVEHAGQRVVFENPENDFPQRVIYWRDDDGNLAARIEGTMGGEAGGMEWSWSPVESF